MRQTWKTIYNVIGRTQNQGISDQFKRVSGSIITDPNLRSYQMNLMVFL